jgi:lipopolysaccharide transport system permease protein
LSSTPAASVPSALQGRVHVTTIEPHHAWWRLNWRELVQNHELLAFLVWRDLKVRYKQTFLGVVWAVIQPLFAMLVFTLFFGRLAKIPTEGVPYPLLAYSGILLWQFFARSLSEASTSLAANERLLTKVYFPRLYVPLAVILAAVFDLAIASLLAVPLLLHYGYHPGVTGLLMPVVVLMVVIAALGVGLFFSALDVRYRDLRYVLPFLSQLWMFGSPVVYPSALVPVRWRELYALNPMVGFIETFRVGLLGTGKVPWTLLASSSASACFLLVLGLFVFQKTERRMTDIV